MCDRHQWVSLGSQKVQTQPPKQSCSKFLSTTLTTSLPSMSKNSAKNCFTWPSCWQLWGTSAVLPSWKWFLFQNFYYTNISLFAKRNYLKPKRQILNKTKATFGCSLIQKGTPQWVAPHIWLDFFMPDAFSDITSMWSVSPPRIELRIFCSLDKCKQLHYGSTKNDNNIIYYNNDL